MNLFLWGTLALLIGGCAVAFVHYYQQLSSARQHALFLHRVGQASSNEALVVLDNRPQRYAKAVWLQKILRELPLVSSSAEFIEASGLQLTVASLLLRSGVGFLLGLWVALWRQQDLLLATILALLVAALPWLWVYRARVMRLAAFEKQLPQALELIALYLRSGRSLPQAFMGATEELTPPVSDEFLACAEEYRLGRPLDEALKKLATRYQSSVGFRLFAIAVSVLGQTGGNLVEVLERIKKTLDAGMAYELRLKALTSESRLSAWILGSLPGVFMGLAAVLSPNYFAGFTTTSLGRTLLFSFLGLWLSGILWVRYLINSKAT